jgi:hypothetical protein
MKAQPKSLVAWLKEFLGFCLFGVIAGAGVGFFMFVRLGFPKESYMIGYMSGLFIGSGIKFGISLWVVRIIFRSLLQLWAQNYFCASHYHFRDMDLQSGGFDRLTNRQAPEPDPNFHPQFNHARSNTADLNTDSFWSDASFRADAPDLSLETEIPVSEKQGSARPYPGWNVVSRKVKSGV